MRPELFAGVMSGTSLDGIDAVVADFAPPEGACRTLGAAHVPMPATLRATLQALQTSGPDELSRSALASLMLADLYAQSILDAVKAAGLTAADLSAAGVHGQTVRHRPDEGWTIQLNDPGRIAERAGVTVVADFRRRDVAAGGQGAPLVPAFHRAMFATPDESRAVLNVGGIANLTMLVPGEPVRGFDTGPGNVLLDLWHAKHRGGAVDVGGAWAASGSPEEALLALLLDEPYFACRAPKSTGRDLFHADWLQHALARRGSDLAANDVQATLVELTARSVADSLARERSDINVVVVCGGGARNPVLMQALRRALAPRRVMTTAALGVAVDHVEALAFAWLAREALAGRAGNVPTATGARGPRVLGAIYPR